MLNFKKSFFSLLIFTFFLLQHSVYAVVTNVQMEMDSNGNTIAAWQDDTNSGHNEIMASVLPAGGSWSTPVNLSSATGAINANNPKIAINSSGNAVVIWTAYNSIIGYNSLYGATLSGLTTWSSTVQISTNNELVYDNYNVRLSDSNDSVVTWTAFSFVVFSNVVRSVADTFGSWSTPVTIAP